MHVSASYMTNKEYYTREHLRRFKRQAMAASRNDDTNTENTRNTRQQSGGTGYDTAKELQRMAAHELLASCAAYSRVLHWPRYLLL